MRTEPLELGTMAREAGNCAVQKLVIGDCCLFETHTLNYV
jgi:hypothetical protein